MKKEIDEKLLASLQAQDPKGLEEAIRRYSPYVAGVLRKTLGAFGTREDLEELASDVFVALWQSAQKLRPHSDLKLWLGVVARNRAFSTCAPSSWSCLWTTASCPLPRSLPPGFGNAGRRPSRCARRC